ncbi:MAG: hypothetical protein R3F55_13335 [Alphaproteobacteria bacterium]
MPSDQNKPTHSGAGSRKPRGRAVLLAHAMAQRENRLFAERRAAPDRSGEDAEHEAAADRRAAPGPVRQPRRDAAERPAPSGLDAMIAKALGPDARGHVKGGAFDRESALTDLIARTQSRLAAGTAAESRRPAPTAAPEPAMPPAGREREAMIAAAMRMHRSQQTVFDGLSLRDRARLRATAEALLDRKAVGAK